MNSSIILRQASARAVARGIRVRPLPPWRIPWAAPLQSTIPGRVGKYDQCRVLSTSLLARTVDVDSNSREPSQKQPADDLSQPVSGATSPEDETRGRLLTTPTRLLKMILPLPFPSPEKRINKKGEKEPAQENLEPLAILVHPQQPLSYVERLIQGEIPRLKTDGYERPPGISFRAEADATESHDKVEQKANGTNVASYSGLGHEGPRRRNVRWVRWSGSTEIGDFIRDAARGREFELNIEGHPEGVRVSVPSFNDRTYYMRMRLRRMSRRIDEMSKVKNECDLLAHQSANRLAQGGFVALAGWWGVVYYLTFHTEMGWDLVEPVTYLAGLTTIMGGYLWFLYMSRDLSYKAAMNVTVSRRQNALYQMKGFDYGSWETLVNDANALRREIRSIAAEYDTEWKEVKDLGGEEVKVTLESEEDEHDGSEEGGQKRKKKNGSKSSGSKPFIEKEAS